MIHHGGGLMKGALFFFLLRLGTSAVRIKAVNRWERSAGIIASRLSS
jgi:hypothetical protein